MSKNEEAEQGDAELTEDELRQITGEEKRPPSKESWTNVV